MNNVFIDANVIAYWLFIGRITKGKRDTKRKEILERYKKLKQAYDFIDFITKRKTEGYTFITSKLALSEVITVLSDFIISEKMSLNGIVTIYWPRYKKDFLLNDEEFRDFQDDITQRINFISSKLDGVVDDKLLELENYPYFVGVLGLLTQDAILLNTAIKKESNYFVTMDRDLLELDKKEEIRKILRIIKPQTMLVILEKKK
ncbi:hypothetical protein DRP07_02480 [Archaeoglobales archaeon]|nr:MAG: hypothetical protein DRP07_02480 [Archaeoglobales archaeon]